MLRLIWFPALLLTLLVGCQAARDQPGAIGAPAGFPTEVYEGVDAARGRVFDIDPAASDVRIYVYRAGALAARGHNHVITAGLLVGAVLVPHAGGAARFDLEIPVHGVRVDDPDVRRAIGHSFAPEVTDAARAGTRDNLLGPAVLDAARHPRVTVASRAIAGELPKLVITAAVTLRGITHELTIPVDVQVAEHRLTATGALAIRQSDFGIEPFSALGGLLRVDDVVMIEFHLVGSAR